MVHVDPVKCQCFRDSFCGVAEGIVKGLSSSCSASSDGHWTTWSDFFGVLYLYPLLISYQYHVSILNAFNQQYHTGKIAPIDSVVHACMVEEAVQVVGQ